MAVLEPAVKGVRCYITKKKHIWNLKISSGIGGGQSTEGGYLVGRLYNERIQLRGSTLLNFAIFCADKRSSWFNTIMRWISLSALQCST